MGGHQYFEDRAPRFGWGYGRESPPPRQVQAPKRATVAKPKRKAEPPLKSRKKQEFKLSKSFQDSTTFSSLRDQHIERMKTGLDGLIRKGTRAKSYTLPGTIATPLIIVPMKPGTWVTGEKVKILYSQLSNL